MLNGQFAIARVAPDPDGGDNLAMITLQWGYDTLEEAKSALPEVAEEHEVELEALAITQTWFARDL